MIKKYIKNIVEKEALKNLVECARCGCLLYKAVATKGKSIVRDVTKIDPDGRLYDEEEIHTTYYCKVHTQRKRSKK